MHNTGERSSVGVYTCNPRTPEVKEEKKASFGYIDEFEGILGFVGLYLKTKHKQN